MAKMVNVNREVDDAFYRYKMPLLVTKIEGRGNGVKTVIVNMSDVGKALARSPSYVTKFFGCELGAQTVMRDDLDRYIVSGRIETVRLQELLDEFIKKFVLCPSCGNPETVLRVTSKKQIEQKCKACGYMGNVPLIHRLTTYILNNPPAGSKKDKKGKTQKERREEKAKARSEKSSVGDDDGGDTVKPSKKDTKALGQVGAQVDAAKARLGGDIDVPDAIDDKEDDDEDWSVDLSEEGIRARTAELGTGVAHLTQTEDLDKSTDERLAIFEKFVIERLSLPKFPAKEVVGEADRLDCKDKGVMVIMQQLFSEGNFIENLKKYQGLLQRFTVDQPKTQKYLLNAYEKIVFERKDELFPKAALILKELYDLDIVDEEVIIAWNDKVSKKNVDKASAESLRKKIKPLVDWLKEAEEEDTEEEDELFVSDPDAVLAADKEKQKEGNQDEAAAEEEEEEEDVDLDDL